MTYNDNIRKLVGGQKKLNRAIRKLRTQEKSASTDSIIRRRFDADGEPYVEIGTDLRSDTNLVINGGFELDAVGWTINTINMTCEVSSEQYYDGAKSLKALYTDEIPTGGLVQILSDNVSVIAGKSYIATVWTQENNIVAGNTLTCSVDEFDELDNVVATNDLTHSSYGDWNKLTASFVANAATVYVHFLFGIIIHPTGGMSASVYFDGISLIPTQSTADIVIDASTTTIKSTATDVNGTLTAGNISATPTANYIPKADGTGKLDVGWMPSTIDADKLDGNHATYFAPASSIVTDHGLLTGLGDDDHSQYLNNTRHDTTTRHSLGTVVPHDDHGMLSGLGDDDHPQYLLTTAKAADSDKLDGIDSSSFGRPVFLTTPLTSTDWDGDSISTQATGIQIDLSTTHSVPAGVKAVMVRCYIRDSASATTNNLYFALSSGSTGYPQYAIRCSGLPNDYLMDTFGIVPCDASGDIYYRSAASGTGTMDVWIVITGYWL